MGETLNNLGKLRRMQQLATREGHFVLSAMDHRGSMRQMLRPNAPDQLSTEDMVDFKLELCRALAPESSGVLLDPEYGVPNAIVRNALPGDVGLLISLESTDYAGDKYNRTAQILPQWGPDNIAQLGASGAKLLVHYRPDLESVAEAQRKVVSSMVESCNKANIPLLLEAVTYRTEEEEANPELYYTRRPHLVAESARQLHSLGPDILKLEFPLSAEVPWDEDAGLQACKELDSAAGSPWVLLSQGVPYDIFEKQVRIACLAGASGFLGGRAIWQEAVKLESPEQRNGFLTTVARGRMKSLAGIVRHHARPWYEKVSIPQETFSPDWFRLS
ncbi:MAG: DUF2090 domain-containing protein [Dehalococcoidia bacterium]|nr:DUF2090 domain-containing protein [Dehalococcoidia bacterium]